MKDDDPISPTTAVSMDQAAHASKRFRSFRLASSKSEANHEFWTRVVLFTAVAGGVYGGIVVPLLNFLAGFPLALIVGTFIVFPFVFAVRTLSGRWRHPWAGPVFGGTVGFVSTFPVWREMDLWMFVVAPMGTTFLGQVGGYIAVRRYWAEVRTEVPWRFSLRTMLVATGWAALVLGSLQGLGMLEPTPAKIILWWLPWQAVLNATFILAGRRRANLPSIHWQANSDAVSA